LKAEDTRILVPFGKVTGSFACSHNIESLDNAPMECPRFYCEDNAKLKSLAGLDLTCTNFDVSETQIRELKDFKLRAKRAYFDGTSITSLRNVHKCILKCEELQVSNIQDSVLGLFFIPGLKRISDDWQTSADDSA
jgi:hypothetical protein